MIKAIFVDFYGTVVHEDGEIIKQITDEIFRQGNAGGPEDIAAYWWRTFQTMCSNSYADHFETQRTIEYRALTETIRQFGASADADRLSARMFAYWRKPPAFAESKDFFEKSPLPVYIVSNIDTDDLRAAIAYHRFQPCGAFTSEDAGAYKPRKELFEYAMKQTGFRAEQIIHIGDSLSSDVNGAKAAGIKPIWIDRSHRKAPLGVAVADNLMQVFDLIKAL